MILNDILSDIDLRYRNTFTTQQKAVWAKDAENDIINLFKIEIPPVTIELTTGSYTYVRPAELKYIENIKTVTIQIDNQTPLPTFIELPFYRNDDGVHADAQYWYTFYSSDRIFIHYPEGDIVDGFNVFFFLDGNASGIADGTSTISVPDKYVEMLKIGTLKRIAQARKDIQMQNNYDAELNNLISDMTWTALIQEPEWVQPTNGNYEPSWQTSYAGWPFVWRG